MHQRERWEMCSRKCLHDGSPKNSIFAAVPKVKHPEISRADKSDKKKQSSGTKMLGVRRWSRKNPRGFEDSTHTMLRLRLAQEGNKKNTQAPRTDSHEQAVAAKIFHRNVPDMPAVFRWSSKKSFLLASKQATSIPLESNLAERSRCCQARSKACRKLREQSPGHASGSESA